MTEDDRKKLNAVLNTQATDNRLLRHLLIIVVSVLTVIIVTFGVLIGIMYKNTKDTITTISDKLDEGVTITIEEVDGEVGNWNVTEEGDIYK